MDLQRNYFPFQAVYPDASTVVKQSPQPDPYLLSSPSGPTPLQFHRIGEFRRKFIRVALPLEEPEPSLRVDLSQYDQDHQVFETNNYPPNAILCYFQGVSRAEIQKVIHVLMSDRSSVAGFFSYFGDGQFFVRLRVAKD